MTLNDILVAVAARLTALWPERPVYVDAIRRGANGSFFVGVVESNERRGLDRRRRRTVGLEILYFLSDDDTTAFLDWAEAMYECFELLEVPDGTSSTRGVRLTERRARRAPEAGAYQFLADAALNFVLAPEAHPTMDHLDHEEEIK